MAKYEITHSCGHTETVQLYGPSKDREYRIKQMESHECADCRAKSAKEFDASKGYAELEGSPKQIAWASDIRAEMIYNFGENAQRIIDNRKDQVSEDALNEFTAAIEDAKAKLGNVSSAKWFIEKGEPRRDGSVQSILSLVQSL